MVQRVPSQAVSETFKESYLDTPNSTFRSYFLVPFWVTIKMGNILVSLSTEHAGEILFANAFWKSLGNSSVISVLLLRYFCLQILIF